MSSSDVYFSPEQPEPFVLLQLSGALLGQDLKIKPFSDTATVICTDTETFQLKDVQQSNSLLFLSEDSVDLDGHKASRLRIQGESASWLETTLMKPNIGPYLANLPLYSTDAGHMTLGVPRALLYASIPASDIEIEMSLKDQLCLDVPEVGGFVKLQVSYVSRLLHVMVNSILAASLQLNSVREQEYISAIEDEDENQSILIFLLHCFSQRQGNVYSIDSTKLIAHIGRDMLDSEASRPVPIDVFKMHWSAKIPATFHKNTHDLELALLDGHYILPTDTTIQSFDPTLLSMEPKVRISELMGVKSRWRDAEIRPYLMLLASGTDKDKQKAVDSMILKLARKVKMGKDIYIESRAR